MSTGTGSSTGKTRRPTAADMTFAGATAPVRSPEPADATGVGPSAARSNVPAPNVGPAVSDSSDPASKLASRIAQNGHASGGMSIPLSALLAPPVEPEMDLVPINVRVPRYVAEALRVAALLARGRTGQQGIVAEALKRHLPRELLDEAYRAAGGGDRAGAP
jgi:hypothetical protein